MESVFSFVSGVEGEGEAGAGDRGEESGWLCVSSSWLLLVVSVAAAMVMMMMLPVNVERVS